MRQADSTIKGYSYQFNKSILETLQAGDSDKVVLEGIIEDIDIQSPTSTTTIQCKYHEEKKYQVSSVAVPILEMLCHHCECAYLGKTVSYILYAYYADNVDSVDIASFLDFLGSTKDKDIIAKYFHRIYSIQDPTILAIANKSQKNKSEKEQLINYYKTNRKSLTLRVNIQDFWNCFTYVKAEQFDELKSKVIQALEKIADHDTAISLFYPNAFSLVASLSAKADVNDRTITKSELINFLQGQKSVLITRWAIEALDRKQILKAKKAQLSSAFASNPDIRAFVFSDEFLNSVGNNLIAFLHEYINKYFKKPKLQKQPIFIFGSNNSVLMQNTLLELYQYQQTANTGLVGTTFVPDSFINNDTCTSDFSYKITLLNNVSVDLLEKCNINQLYLIGKTDISLSSPNYYVDELDVTDVNTLRYLVGLTKTLEV